MQTSWIVTFGCPRHLLTCKTDLAAERCQGADVQAGSYGRPGSNSSHAAGVSVRFASLQARFAHDFGSTSQIAPPPADVQGLAAMMSKERAALRGPLFALGLPSATCFG
jgi:hypothetical protein